MSKKWETVFTTNPHKSYEERKEKANKADKLRKKVIGKTVSLSYILLKAEGDRLGDQKAYEEEKLLAAFAEKKVKSRKGIKKALYLLKKKAKEEEKKKQKKENKNRL